MRTTITLDDDVAVELSRLQKARDESFKQTLNAVLRAGVAVLRARRPRAGVRYETAPVSLGTPRLAQIDDVAEVLAFAEGEEHR